ncbi:GNAT family N-acetyltransferase [Streptococcus dentasini]
MNLPSQRWERLPLSWLINCLVGGYADFTAYFDRGNFCGFTYSLKSDKVYYLLFLAVPKDLRSKGYGSTILKAVAQKAGDCPCILVIEPLDTSAGNYSQRLRRLAFYQANDYHLIPYYYYEDSQ